MHHNTWDFNDWSTVGPATASAFSNVQDELLRVMGKPTWKRLLLNGRIEYSSTPTYVTSDINYVYSVLRSRGTTNRGQALRRDIMNLFKLVIHVEIVDQDFKGIRCPIPETRTLSLKTTYMIRKYKKRSELPFGLKLMNKYKFKGERVCGSAKAVL